MQFIRSGDGDKSKELAAGYAARVGGTWLRIYPDTEVGSSISKRKKCALPFRSAGTVLTHRAVGLDVASSLVDGAGSDLGLYSGD